MRNRLIGIALGIVIGVMLLWRQGRQPIRPAWDLMPEYGGAVETVAVQYTQESAQDLLPCYRSFFSQLDREVEVIAVTGNREDAESFSRSVRSWDTAEPVKLRTVVVGRPITGWCRDRFLVAEGKPRLLICPSQAETGVPSRTNDGLVAPALSRARPSRFRTTRAIWKFDAGDFLPLKSCVIVSDNLWRKNGRPPDFRDQLRRITGRKIVWLRGAPDHHIGMYIAPVDEHTLLVGDPLMGRELWSPEMEKKFGRALFSPTDIAPFERAAEQLRTQGFRLIPIPLVILGPQVFITYTNGIFETRGGRRIAYIPWYDEPALDSRAKAVYEKAGYQVRAVRVGRLYRYRGTIGCLVNVLERSR